MPYTDLDQLPDAVKKLPKKLQKLWMVVWNDAFSRCMKKGGNESKCEGSASAQAWSVVNKNREDDMGNELRSVISYQDLPLGDRYEAWDRDAADRRVRNWASSDHSGDKDKMDWSKYRQAFFWYDADNPENFGSYKLMFGDVKNGSLCAMPRGVFLCAAMMQGARGGVDIPAADRDAVKAHIARYYDKMAKQFDDPDIIPPWERSGSRNEIETRTLQPCEVRIEGDAKPVIRGYAAVFDKIADVYQIKEKIRRGAFARTINNADIRALINHDPNYVLGRNKAQTLKLAEDDKGLAVEIFPDPKIQFVHDLIISMQRRDINQMSFGFQVVQEEWDQDKKVRTLVEVKLFDVSVVTFPAYPQTSAHVRSGPKSYGINLELLDRAVCRARDGSMTAMDEEILRSSIQILQAITPATNKPEPEPDPAEVHSGASDRDSAEVHSQSWGRDLSFIRQRLRALELETLLYR